MNEMNSVPNPMAGIPPSPAPNDDDHRLSLLPLSPSSLLPPSSVPSPLDFDEVDDHEEDGGGKKIKDLRWMEANSDAQQHQQQQYATSAEGGTSFIPVNFTSHIVASKPSSSSLASSHPSHGSFASTQTADSSTVYQNLTPDSGVMFAHQHHQGGNGRARSASASYAAAYATTTANTATATTFSTTAAPNYPATSIGATSTTAASAGSTTTAPTDQNRRIKRLERNRESARLSRKRRKAYLEELEAKVHSMSAQMDQERVAYVLNFLKDVKSRFSSGSTGNTTNNNISTGAMGGIQISQNAGIKHNIQSTLPSSSTNNINNNQRILNEPKTRIPPVLQTIYTFQHAYLSSLVISKESKFILWLLLQREGFWRGGRGNSERLSAARIGERLLNNGMYRAGPSEGMWPLLCHEIGLSYEQEDRVRNTQRAILADSKTWISRHTAAASKNVLDSMQTAISGMHEVAKQREESILGVLTPEQRGKFITWALQKSNSIRLAAQFKLGQMHQDNEYEVSPERHVSANMYIVDHRLSNINSSLVPAPPIVHPSRLKRLSRRPCFESLASQDAPENTKSNRLSRDASFPSTGSLKRTLSDLNGMEDSQPTVSHAHSGITVESAQAAAQPSVRAVFQDIMPIVPQEYQQQMHLQHFRAIPTSSQVIIPATAPSPMTVAPQELYARSRVGSTIRTQQQHYQADVLLPPSSDDIDIPMPTPVSVLLRTQDEFLDVETSGVPLEVTSAMQPPESGFIPSIEYAPEPVASHGLSSRSYRSAPNLYSANEFDYPSLMPTTMMPVPEEGLAKSNNEEDGFDLEALGDPNDWAIGESFDMDLTS